jgi:hypothetical protein
VKFAIYGVPTVYGVVAPSCGCIWNYLNKKRFRFRNDNYRSGLKVNVFLSTHCHGPAFKIVGVQSRNKCRLWNVERKEWAGLFVFN